MPLPASVSLETGIKICVNNWGYLSPRRSCGSCQCDAPVSGLTVTGPAPIMTRVEQSRMVLSACALSASVVYESRVGNVQTSVSGDDIADAWSLTGCWRRGVFCF